MRTILILMDSLNRHMLPCYNKDSFVKTPNIERLAKSSVVFENHWLGSAPCIPARKDIFTGRLGFLERHWGPIEPIDVTLQQVLRENNIFTHITTDHHHYFNIGGEDYCQQFNTWDFQRGQVTDPWVSRVKAPALPEKFYGMMKSQYELNKTAYTSEEEYPTPRTFRSACQWLENNRDADNYFLMIEAFDPHEPFDCPKKYLNMYPDNYNGLVFNSSTYEPVTEPAEAVGHLRNRYAATLTMADCWMGKLLDTLETLELFEDTLILFTADHGHLLGEHGWTGKNKMHAYNELSHLPFIVHLPGNARAGERVAAITQNIDIMPTLLDYYGIEIPDSVKGFSLKGILEGVQETVRDTALYGWFGRAVNITDGKHTYFRAPAREDNYPLYQYACIPTTLWEYLGKGCVEEIEMGRFLKRTRYPVYKIPMSKKGEIFKGTTHIRETLLFDIENDYEQCNTIKDRNIENDMIAKLLTAMQYAEAPQEQYERLGLYLNRI